MRITVTSKRRNDLLKRLEIVFRVDQNGGTPPRLLVRKELAKILNVDLDRVYVKKMITKTGSLVTVGEANIYDSVEQAMRIEPKYIILRNSPKKE